MPLLCPERAAAPAQRRRLVALDARRSARPLALRGDGVVLVPGRLRHVLAGGGRAPRGGVAARPGATRGARDRRGAPRARRAIRLVLRALRARASDGRAVRDEAARESLPHEPVLDPARARARLLLAPCAPSRGARPRGRRADRSVARAGSPDAAVRLGRGALPLLPLPRPPDPAVRAARGLDPGRGRARPLPEPGARRVARGGGARDRRRRLAPSLQPDRVVPPGREALATSARRLGPPRARRARRRSARPPPRPQPRRDRVGPRAREPDRRDPRHLRGPALPVLPAESDSRRDPGLPSGGPSRRAALPRAAAERRLPALAGVPARGRALRLAADGARRSRRPVRQQPGPELAARLDARCASAGRGGATAVGPVIRPSPRAVAARADRAPARARAGASRRTARRTRAATESP